MALIPRKRRKRTQLSGLKVAEVSIVDNPANEAARFLFTKRHTQSQDQQTFVANAVQQLTAMENELHKMLGKVGAALRKAKELDAELKSNGRTEARTRAQPKYTDILARRED